MKRRYFIRPSSALGCFSRYDDIKAIFRDWKTFSSENAQSPFWPLAEETYAYPQSRTGSKGAPVCRRGCRPITPGSRSIVQDAFGPRRFKALEPQIRNIMNEAVDAFADKGEADLIADFAFEVPALVIFCLLGVPPEEAPHVKAWSESRALLTWGNLSPEQQIPHAHNMVRYWECAAIWWRGGTNKRATIFPAILCACGGTAPTSATTRSPPSATANYSPARRRRPA